MILNGRIFGESEYESDSENNDGEEITFTDETIQITEAMNFQVWGIITHIIHKAN